MEIHDCIRPIIRSLQSSERCFSHAFEMTGSAKDKILLLVNTYNQTSCANLLLVGVYAGTATLQFYKSLRN